MLRDRDKNVMELLSQRLCPARNNIDGADLLIYGAGRF
jgi:hypothetical protein